MCLTKEQMASYVERRFVLWPDYFSQTEVELMKAELPALFDDDSPRRVVERLGGASRSVYGSHLINDLIRCLTRHPKIVEAVKQIVGHEVYVYQFEINAKAAFGGDVWQWHQDYIFWRAEDGMPEPRGRALPSSSTK